MKIRTDILRKIWKNRTVRNGWKRRKRKRRKTRTHGIRNRWKKRTVRNRKRWRKRTDRKIRRMDRNRMRYNEE